jgi:hypothetical protein
MNELDCVLEKTITDDTLIKSGAGRIFGVIVNSHTSGKMILVNGTTAYNEEADSATATLTFTDSVSDGEQVIIGDEVYEFDTDEDVSEGAIAVDVSGGATASDAVSALVSAITSDSELVSGADGTGDTVDITALVAGVSGNDIAVSTDCANASWGEEVETLSGGVDANTKMGNTYTFATGSQVITFPRPRTFGTGLFIDLDGSTANLTIQYSEN